MDKILAICEYKNCIFHYRMAKYESTIPFKEKLVFSTKKWRYHMIMVRDAPLTDLDWLLDNEDDHLVKFNKSFKKCMKFHWSWITYFKLKVFQLLLMIEMSKRNIFFGE